MSNVTTTNIDPAIAARLASGANWFYWIAGLSLVNALAHSFGSNWSFALGLGITQVLTAMIIPEAGEAAGTIPAILGWILMVALIGLFAFFGWVSRKPSLVVFVIGMSLFALDGAIFIFASDWLGVGLHVLALYFLWQGFVAAREALREPVAPTRA